MALRRAGKFKESLSCSMEAKEIIEKMLGPNNLHPLFSRILGNMINVCRNLRDFVQAKKYCDEAINIERKNPKIEDDCPGLVIILFKLSVICEDLGEESQAVVHLEEAREIAKAAGSKHHIVFEVLLKLVTKYFRMFSFVKCKMYLDEALEIANTIPKENAPANVLKLLELKKQFGYR